MANVKSVLDVSKVKFKHIEEFFELKNAVATDNGTVKYEFKCNKCLPIKKIIKSSSQNAYSNLNSHIEHIHPSIKAAFVNAKKPSKTQTKTQDQTSNEDIFHRPRNLTKDESKDMIRQYIIDRNEPFTLVRDEAFKKLVKGLNPTATVPAY